VTIPFSAERSAEGEVAGKELFGRLEIPLIPDAVVERLNQLGRISCHNFETECRHREASQALRLRHFGWVFDV
jgi:hypothetical protein